MKKILVLLLAFMMSIPVWGIGWGKSKDIKIVVYPAEATIKVNGSYYGTGTADIKIQKGDFVSIECSYPGYENVNTRIYANDNRKTVEIKLKEDKLLKQTLESSTANKFFTVTVNKSLYSDDPTTGKRNSENAWKLAHNVLLKYFDEIMVSDITSGFIQTPWLYKNYVEANKTIRCRVTIKESNIGGDLTFQIKLSSEIASIQSSNREEAFIETNRIIKEFDSLIEEFQSRLGQK